MGRLGLTATQWDALERLFVAGRWDQVKEFLAGRVTAAYGDPDAGRDGRSRPRDIYRRLAPSPAPHPDRDGDERQGSEEGTRQHDSKNPSNQGE